MCVSIYTVLSFPLKNRTTDTKKEPHVVIVSDYQNRANLKPPVVGILMGEQNAPNISAGDYFYIYNKYQLFWFQKTAQRARKYSTKTQVSHHLDQE